ncbi:MAG: HIT family protein [Propionibacteriales bacterium]|nr:MAG: HIT family protein [Propionibacteriales bacterium]
MDCVFCAIVAGDLPSRQIYADDAAIAFLDIAPFQPGHTLVIPRKHVADFREEAEVMAELAPAIHEASKLLTSKLHCDGINLLSNAGATAGQEVFHLHVHLIPRYASAPGLRNMVPDQRPVADLDGTFSQLTS